MPCRNAAKTRNQFKFVGVPQTTGSISAASRPKFAILRRHVENILLLNIFFSDGRYVPFLRRYSPTNVCDGAVMAIFGDFLRPVFQRAACSTFQTCILIRTTATPCVEVWQTSNLRRLRLGEERKKEETTGQKSNVRICCAGRPCGPMPNVMTALPNIGGALCSTPQSLAVVHYTRVPCSNAAKTRNPLKFAWVLQTRQQISAASRAKFTIL